MSVPNQIPESNYVGNGTTTTFAANFEYASDSDVFVTVNGVTPEIGQATFANGVFTFITAPANGTAVRVYRSTPIERDTEYDNHDNVFRPKVVNVDFDRIWFVLQEYLLSLGITSSRITQEIVDRIQADAEMMNYILNEDNELKADYILRDENLKKYIDQTLGALLELPDFHGIEAQFVKDASGKSQQKINDNVKSQFGNCVELFADSLGVKNFGDGVYRNVSELWLAGSANKIYASQAQAESVLGWTFASWLNVGLYTTIDTFVIQLLINKLHTDFMTTGVVQTIRYKSDATYVVLGLRWKSGVQHVCDGSYKILKRPALDVTSESILKWWRPITLDEATFSTAAQCAPRLLVSGLHIDGNLANMNWTYKTYNQEQAANLFLNATSVGSADIRAKFKFERFKSGNSVADAIQPRSNVDVILDNPEFYDSFRGGLVITGGNSRIIMNGGVSENARYDTEIDGAGFGLNYKSYIEINNYSQDKMGGGDFVGGCDIQALYGGETHLNNFKVFTEPTNINSDNGSILTIDSNSRLSLGVSSSANNRYINPNNDTIEAEFVIVKDGGSLAILPNNSTHLSDVGSVCNLNSKFRKASGSIVAPASVIVFSAQNNTNPLQFVFDVESTVDSAALISGTSRLEIKRAKHNSERLLTGLSQTATQAPKLKIGQVEGSSRTVALLSNAVLGASNLDNSLELTQACVIPQSQNIIEQSYGDGLFKVIKSRRVILGDSVPTATTHSFNGDTYRLNTIESGKPYEWVATTARHSKTASTWRPTKWAVGVFTTANLPVLTSMDVGAQNIDSTLNKLVTWTGTAWI